ncbi:hypothetical protein M9H77_24295 [Catharanthus roseus]|uniref:Uncharacterized protein n=1 Tax=Catharanthus roseus TaxID=4058 RepID=A0ACC0AWY0_CATRO|nr:hypothetical protein M9H77_24295 [Catharanthus roseus]
MAACRKDSSIAIKASVFVGLVCLTLLSVSGEAETLIEQGPCSQFPDCNQHCIDIRLGTGECIHLIPSDPTSLLPCLDSHIIGNLLSSLLLPIFLLFMMFYRIKRRKACASP